MQGSLKDEDAGPLKLKMQEPLKDKDAGVSKRYAGASKR